MCEIAPMKRKFSPPDTTPEFAKLLASKVKVSTGYASELASGKKTPSLEKAIAFENAYGIPPSFWLGRV